MRLFTRWKRRKASGEADLDVRSRDENERFRAQHDGLIQGPAQPAADRWQRRTDSEFKPPSH